MSKIDLSKRGRYLSKLLRHDPEDLKMDDQGYVDIKEVLDKLKISRAELYDIVYLDNKSRFSFDSSVDKIRANQGHSIKLNLGFKEADHKEVPFTLFHGTTVDKLPSILENGISKMFRHHVHLSKTKGIADKVACRRKNKRPCVISIDTIAMLEDGHTFYVSTNHVWLTGHVDPIYFIEIKF